MRRASWIVVMSVLGWLAIGTASASAGVWRRQVTPLPATGASSIVLNGVSCTPASTCTAVGSYVNAGDVTVTLAEVWSGAGWNVEPTPNPAGAAWSVLNSVSCTSASTCTAVGSSANGTLAEAWNGTSWTIQTTPNPAANSFLNGVSCTATNACTAVGSSGPTAQTLAEAWDGTSWSVQTTPDNVGSFGTPGPNVLSGVSCVSSISCTAVGHWTDTDVNDDVCPLAFSWDGSTWQQQSPVCPGMNPGLMMGPDAILSSVSCTAVGACTAAGNYLNQENQHTLGERLTGSTWAQQTTPNQTGTFGSIVPNTLLGTSCSGPHTCEAVGSFIDTDANADVCPVAMGWGGAAAWGAQLPLCPGQNAAQMQGPNAQFNAVSCTAELACTAVGYFYDVSRKVALVERYSH